MDDTDDKLLPSQGPKPKRKKTSTELSEAKVYIRTYLQMGGMFPCMISTGVAKLELGHVLLQYLMDV